MSRFGSQLLEGCKMLDKFEESVCVTYVDIYRLKALNYHTLGCSYFLTDFSRFNRSVTETQNVIKKEEFEILDSFFN